MWGLDFRVQGLGFRVEGLGFRERRAGHSLVDTIQISKSIFPFNHFQTTRDIFCSATLSNERIRDVYCTID